MAGYTPDEIQAVVEKLVLSTIRRPYDTLGVRRTDISFNDVQEAAASVFILYPGCPFYVLWLGTQRIGDLLVAEATVIESLLDALEATGLNMLPIEDVSTLFNAQAALQELGGAAGKRGGVFKDITRAPAFQRYSANVDAFLAGPGANIKNAGTIVMAPQQARSAIPGLMRQLVEAHDRLLGAVEGIAGGIEDYNQVNLPSVVSSSVLNNAARLVGADAAALDALTPNERLSLIRQTVLNILATRAVVTTFGSFAGPSDYYTLDGLGTPYADASREAAPAEAQGTEQGAVGIIRGLNDELTLAIDGGAPATLLLSPSILATLNGSLDDAGFIIGDGVNPNAGGYSLINNNKLRILVDGAPYVAPLTISATVSTPRTAEEVAADIQAVLPAGVVAEGYYAPLRYSGSIDIPAGIDQVWTIPVPGASNLAALDISDRDTVRVIGGLNPGFYPIAAVTSDTISVLGVTVAEPGAIVEIGPAHRRVRVRCNNAVAQLPLETLLKVEADDEVSRAGCLTLGFFNGLFSRCTRTTMDLAATDINFKAPDVTASAIPVFDLEGIPARTDLLRPKQVTLSRVRMVGIQSFVGLTLTFIVTELTLAGVVKMGDALVLRSGVSPGLYFSVTAINGDTPGVPVELAVGDVLTATGLMSSGADAGVFAELGPPVALSKYAVVVVSSGPNAGQYTVESQGPTPLDITLVTTLPLTISGRLALDMEVSVGGLVVLFKSHKKNIQSQLLITGSGAELFFPTSATAAFGTTPWFQLPSVPRGLQAGDVLETYPTDYKTPLGSYRISGVSGRILQLGKNIPSNISWQFTVQPTPFARLRVGTMNDYGDMKTKLDGWLARGTNQEAFFSNLNRLVNPLLVNTNPTAVQVGSAMNELRLFYSYLLANQSLAPVTSLDTILSSFHVEPVQAIDTLLRSFVEKGSSRANDLLLRGQFALFFGLTADGSSYAGAFQEAARAVAMADLPVRRINRKEAQSSQLLAQTVSPDYEFSANSVSEKVLPDIPQGFGEPSGFGKK